MMRVMLCTYLEIARELTEMADLLEIDGANPFRIRAYRNAVHTVEDHSTPLRKLVEQESGTIAHDYAKALREVGLANRRMMGRTGGLGILDPERRDEALAGAYAKSFSDRKTQARAQAREYLSGALTANRAVAGAYAPQLAADQRDRERQASGMQMLLDLTQDRPPTNFNFNVSTPVSYRGNDPFNVPGLSFTGPTTYTTPSTI